MSTERLRLQKESMESMRKLQQECSRLEIELKENAHKLHTEKEVAILEKEVVFEDLLPLISCSLLSLRLKHQ